MPVLVDQIPNYKERNITMGTLKTQMLWDSIRKGDLSATVTLLENGNINLEERDENGQTFLMLACELGEINIVRELLDSNVDVNAVDNEKWCALLCAAKEGHLEVVIELLERGANIEHRDMSGWTALMWACYKGKSLVVQELMDRGANPNVKAEFGVTCLSWAAGRGHTDVAKYLIQKGAKVNAADKYGTTALIWASRKGNLDIVTALLDAGASVESVGMNSWTAILCATKGGYSEIVQQLLEHDPNVNATDKDGFTALCIAAKEGYADIAHELLAKGAYVNIADKAGDTILIHAVKGGHLEIVRALVNKYADVDVEGADGKTALYWAVEKGHSAVVYLLLDCDPDLEICTKVSSIHSAVVYLLLDCDPDLEISTKDGDTPLLKAVRNRNEDILRMLLDKNAKVSVVDKRGDTALHISLRARSKKITELLLRNPRNSRLLYRPNKAGETPYQIDAYHQKGILTQIYGHKNLNAADGENLLGYDIYSSALADILSDPSLNTPITVGLYAKWGSGKSFLLGKLQKEMKTFTIASVDEHFSFCWTLFFLLLFINNIIGLSLALAVSWQIGLGIGLGLFVLEYGFLAAIFILVRKHNLRVPNNISLMLGKELRALTLLIKVLFCNPKPQSAKKIDVPTVKFLFSESTRLTSVGGEKALAAMIGTLGDSLELEYGRLVARLFKVFKDHPDKSYNSRFKTFCCIPYFVYIFTVLLCLEAAIFILVSYARDDSEFFDPVTNTTSTNFETRIQSNVVVFATLIVFSVIIGGAFVLNIFTWGKAILAIVQSQKRRVMHAGSQLDKIKLDGLMHRLKYEVDLMTRMVTNMDRFTENQTRLVVIVDGLDSCEQDKVLQVLDTIKTLFSDEDSPFITILAVDPHIIIKGIESNIKTFVDSNVNGFDYLRNVVHLPFYLQSQGMAIQKETMTQGFSQYDISVETSRPKVQHQESTISSTTVFEMKKKSRRKADHRSDSLSLGAGTSNFDITGNFFTKNDYFSDVNPRSMRRLLNIVAVTGRLLRAYNIDFSWYRLASWINIIEQWPYRASWIILYYEEKEMMDNNCTLYSIYQKIADKLPVSKEVEPLLEIDRNPRKLEAFLSSKSSSKSLMLTIADLKKFLPCTINLDPYLRKLIRELQKSTDIFRPDFPINLYPPTPGLPPPGASSSTPASTEQLRRTNSGRGPLVATPNIYPTERSVPPIMTQFSPMPFYGPQFYGMPPFMPQMGPVPAASSPKCPAPNSLIKGYRNEKLSSMSVADVCQLLSKLNGINKTFLQQYQDCVTENNISGRVLVTCDLNELRQVLAMKFGDWQLFKTAVNSLIEMEKNGSVKKPDLEKRESNNVVQTDSGNSIASASSASNTTTASNQKYDSPQKYTFPKKENDEFETISENEELVMLRKKNKMPRNDSVVAQMSYERELINEVMQGFMEMDEEEEDGEEEVEADGASTPTESISSALENESINRKVLPVQFSLSSHHSNEDISDSPKISPKDTEPLLRMTEYTPSKTEAIIHSHHAGLDEIRQIISKDLEDQELSSANKSSRSLLFDNYTKEGAMSTDSAGFGVDSIEVINEVDRHGHLQKQSELEESVPDFTVMSPDRSSASAPERLGSSPSGSDSIQMITLNGKKDKGPEAFV